MNFDRIRYFQVFAKTGSLTRAAELLGISQPALSKALRSLEQETGLVLVEAQGRGLRLTPVGEALRDETEKLLTSWMEIPAKVRSGSSWNPTRIGSFEVFTTYFLGHLAAFTDLGQLEVHEFRPGKMEEAVASERVDLAITYNPVPRSGVEFVEVGSIRMGIFGASKFRDSAFASLPFVVPLMPAEGTPSKTDGLDGWPDHRVQRQVSYKVTMMESAMELCRRGLGVAYLPSFIVGLHNEGLRVDRQLIELTSPIEERERLQSVYLVQKQGRQETPLVRQIAKAIRQLA